MSIKSPKCHACWNIVDMQYIEMYLDELRQYIYLDVYVTYVNKFTVMN
jgi:hypothetical protein